LAQHAPSEALRTQADLLGYELLQGLDTEQRNVVAGLLQRKRFSAGETIIEIGDPADHLFFIATGMVSVLLTGAELPSRRLATFSAGMVFGEMAVLDRAPRSARIVADTEVECDLLNVEDFTALARQHPQIKIVLLRNLALGMSARLRKANRQLSVLS
jgi:glutaminase